MHFTLFNEKIKANRSPFKHDFNTSLTLPGWLNDSKHGANERQKMYRAHVSDCRSRESEFVRAAFFAKKPPQKRHIIIIITPIIAPSDIKRKEKLTENCKINKNWL